MVAFFHFRFDVLIINKLRHNYANIPRRYGQEHTYPNKIVNQQIGPTRRLCNHVIFPIFTTRREVLVTEIVEVGKIGKVVSFFPKTFSCTSHSNKLFQPIKCMCPLCLNKTIEMEYGLKGHSTFF